MISILKNIFNGEQDKLSRLLKKAFDDEDYRAPFYEEFLMSDIYFIAIENDGVVFDAEKDSQLDFNIKVIYDEERNPFLPIFSTAEAATCFIDEDDESPVCINTTEFLFMVQNHCLLLNPGSAICKEFDQSEIAILLEHVIQSNAFGKGSCVEAYNPEDLKIIMPKEEPEDMLRELSEFFVTVPEIKSAYYALCEDNTNTAGVHSLVVLDIHEEDSGIIYKVVEFSKIYYDQGICVDFAILNDKQDAISKYCERMPAFYQRKSS